LNISDKFLFVLFWVFSVCLGFTLAIITEHGEHFYTFVIYLSFVIVFVNAREFNSSQLFATAMNIFSYMLILTVHHDYYRLSFFLFCALILFLFLILDVFTIGHWILLAFLIAVTLIYIFVYDITFAPYDLLKLAIEILGATLPIIIFKIRFK
jgi:hypothetical protein